MVFNAGKVITAAQLNDIEAAAGTVAVFETDEVVAFEGPAPGGVYGDLATVGPTVADLALEAGQRVEVIMQARITCIAPGDGTEVSGYMGFEVSGEAAQAAADAEAAVVRVNSTGATTEAVEVKIDVTQVRSSFFTAPSTGDYTFEMKYKDILSNGGNTFGNRRITVRDA